MRPKKALSKKDKMEYILAYMLYPFVCLFKRLSKRPKAHKTVGRKITAGALAFIMMFTALPLYAFADTPDGILYGDVNRDKTIDDKDVSDLKKYLAEYEIEIDEQAADVNTDGKIDLLDLLLLEKYVAGLDVILGEVCTITFDTDGGSSVQPVKLQKGSSLKQTPRTSKNGYTFLGWFTAEGTPFYAEDEITNDLTLYAKYEKMAPKEMLNLSSFSLDDQLTTLSFIITSSAPLSADEVKSKIKLTPMDGSDPVELNVTSAGDNRFTVKAEKEFTPGASYEMTLDEGLNFENKADTIRTAYFTIYNEEVANLTLSDNIKYIKDTDDMSYILKGETQSIPVLESGLLSSDKNELVEGTFDYSAGGIAEGDILCIYEETDPRDRDYIDGDYSDDSVAYIKVIKITGITISFKSLDESAAKDVVFIPDTIPFSTSVLPSGNTGTVEMGDFDLAAWSSMGNTEAPVFDKGDFLVFYHGNFDDLNDDSPVYFAKVTAINNTTITFEKTTAEEMEKSMSLFLENPVSGDDLLENVDTERLEKQIETQVLNSGFAEDAAYYLANAATQTNGFKNISNLTNISFTDENGRQLTAAQLRGIGGTIELGDNIKVTVELGSSSKYFRDGIRLALGIEAEFSVDVGDGGELKIELKATFVEEISVNIDADVKAKWKWYFIIPVLKDLTFRASVDLKNYAGISVDVKIYTVEKEEESLWSKLKDYKEEYKDVFEKIEELQEKVEKAKETVDKIKGYKEDIEKLWASLPAGVEGDYKQLINTLGELNVTEELLGLLNLTSETELDAGVRNLMDRYSEMLENESDWIELLNKEICAQDNLIYIFAIGIEVNFIIKANVNIALGANMEYVVGKRYSFWMNVFSGTSGNSQMDLLDEKFAFQFYVMGELGLKMGIEAGIAVGLFSTKLGSIGVTAEFGPYVKLWGYFIYEYIKLRPANTNTWDYDERMMGALYLEFGIYLEMTFKAQLFDGAIKYEPTLLDKEWPLLTAGERYNVYDFAYEIDDDEILLVNDVDNNSVNGITMTLPESYFLMSRIDLCEGDQDQYAFGNGKFNYSLSNRHFSIDKNTGLITVNVPDGVQYMECNLTLTWKSDKLAFSSRDLSVTIPLVWTNLSTDELNEKFTASVKVGNAEDGYTTVWSSRVNKNQPFDLPTEQEILKLINYDSYNVTGSGNLKYSDYKGYGDQQKEGLAILSDTTYYFDVTPRKYSITIKDIENKNGSAENRTYTAKFGESFALDSLKTSGSNDSKTGKYTAFLKVSAKNSAGNTLNSNVTRVIDIGFAREILNGATYTAVYADNSVTVTYSFEGVELSDKVIKIQKGSTPPDIFTTDVTALNALVTGVTPSIGPVLSSTVYTIMCKVQVKPIVKRTINYQTSGGSPIDSAEYPEGSAILPPAEPSKNGYDFDGWYSDKELLIPFNFTVMPENDITIYAKWIGRKFEVSFDANEGALPENTTNPITVTYGDTYGTLPVPVRTGFAFLGWYTERVSGNKISAQTEVSLSGSQKLYAHWGEKATIQQSVISFTPNQSYNYNGNHQPVIFTTGTSGIPYGSFKIEYKRQGLDSQWKSEAVNAGTYDIKVTRPEDDTYRYFEKTYTAVMKINKIARTINAIPVMKETLYACLLIDSLPKDAYPGDGTLQYAVSLSQTVPTTGWQNAKAFVNLPKGNYYLFARVLEGENYFATSNVAVSSTSYSVAGITRNSFGFNYYTYIKTSDIKNAGTDSTIGGYLSFVDGSQSNWTHFYYDNINDFERDRGDYYYMNMSNALEPWMISDATITFNEGGTASGWHCAYFYPEARYSEYSGQTIKGSTINVNRWFENKTDSQSGSTGDSFKRKITYVGNFDSSATINGFVRNMTVKGKDADYTFSYNGTIRDQYAHWDGLFVHSYNAYEQSDAPTLSVSCNGYEEYFDVGINTITLKRSGLYSAMTQNGVDSVTATVTLQFPTRSTTAQTATWTRQVTYTRDQSNQSSASSNTVLMQKASSTFSRISMPAVASVVNRENGFVDVTLNVSDNAGIWGLKAEVEYDHDVLTLTGYTAGDVFDANEITPPESLTKDKFILLASRNDFGNTDKNGKLITLTFKVNGDKQITDYPVSFNLIQAINSDSDTMDVGLNKNAPAISVDGNTDAIRKEDTVLITASGGTSTVNKVEVRKDNGQYTDITETYTAGYKVVENGAYTFRVTSATGETATTTLTYTKIDTAKPVIEIDSGSYCESSWVNDSITLSLTNKTANLGTTTFMYNPGDGWKPYTAPITVSTGDGVISYMFKAISESGVESDVKNFIIKRDTVVPTGEIKIDKNSWSSLLNTITFGLMFKDKQSVDVTAFDNESGIKTIEYYIANAKVDSPSSISEWQTYDKAFNIEPNNKYVVYAKITDNVGNSTIISTDGLVIDNIIPVISGITDGKIYCEAQAVTVSDDNLKSVTVNGTEVTLTNGKFTLAPASTAQEIIVTDKAGNSVRVTVTVNNGHTWDEGKVTKQPSAAETGEKTYTCIHCGATKKEVLGKLAPQIIISAKLEWIQGTNTPITFKSDAAFEDFESVSVDGTVIDARNYTVSQGSIIVELKAEYMATLTAGKHTLNINSKTGTASAEFTVIAKQTTPETETPKTGIDRSKFLGITILFVSGGALTAFGIGKKKKYRVVKKTTV